MLRTTLLVFALLLAIPSTVGAEDIPDSTSAKVVKVESGEVLVVKLDSGKQIKVRVLGIDCNKKARAAAATMVGRKKVKLRSDKGFLPILQDQFGRYVAYVEMDGGEDFGYELLKAGQCSTDQWKLPHPKRAEYASAN